MADITIASTLFNAIDKATESAVAGDVSKLIGFVGGIMGGLYMVYMLAKLLVYIWQGLDYTFKDWLINMLKCVAVTFVAVGNGYYIGTVAPAIISLPDALAGSLITGGDNTSNLVDNILSKTVDTVFNSADALPSIIPHTGTFIMGFIGIGLYLAGALPFLSVVVATLIVNKIAIALYAIIGPLFILFLLFPQFASWFYNWLGGIFAFSVTQFFFVVCITIQFDFIDQQLIQKLGANALTISDGFIMLLVFSAFIVLSAAIPAFASGLFGGHAGSVTDGLASMPFVGKPIGLARNLGMKTGAAAGRGVAGLAGRLTNRIKG